MTETGTNQEEVARLPKIADRFATINDGLTRMNDQCGYICDLIRPILRSQMPADQIEKPIAVSEKPSLDTNEVNCELIILLDNIITRQARLIENNDDIIERIDV